MRKVTVLEHISLDGVIQAPGGPDEDTSGGFAHGGWIASYSDASLGKVPGKADERAVRPAAGAYNLRFGSLIGRSMRTYGRA